MLGEGLRLGGEAVGGAVDALSGLAQLGGDLLVSGAYQRSGLAGIFGATPSFVQAADARNTAVADGIVSGRVVTNTLYGIAGGIDAALLGNDLGPAARGLGGLAAGFGIGEAASVVAGATRVGTVVGEVSAIGAPTGEFYSVAFETALKPTSYPSISRGAHFQEANKSLLQAMEQDAAFASDVQSLGINLRDVPGVALFYTRDQPPK